MWDQIEKKLIYDNDILLSKKNIQLFVLSSNVHYQLSIRVGEVYIYFLPPGIKK